MGIIVMLPCNLRAESSMSCHELASVKPVRRLSRAAGEVKAQADCLPPNSKISNFVSLFTQVRIVLCCRELFVSNVDGDFMPKILATETI